MSLQTSSRTMNITTAARQTAVISKAVDLIRARRRVFLYRSMIADVNTPYNFVQSFVTLHFPHLHRVQTQPNEVNQNIGRLSRLKSIGRSLRLERLRRCYRLVQTPSNSSPAIAVPKITRYLS